MRKIALSILAGAAAIAMTAPASAAVTLFSSPGAVQPSENVLLNSGQMGTTITGNTNQTNTSVTFRSLNGDVLTAPANGQARVTTTESTPSLDNFSFALTGGQTFTSFEFNLFNSLDTSQTVTITTNNGSQSFALNGNGQNFFSGLATGSDFFTSVTVDASGLGVQDVRQVRIGGIASPTGAVPEPATWAMMLVGFGAAGYSLRRRKRVVLQAA